MLSEGPETLSQSSQGGLGADPGQDRVGGFWLFAIPAARGCCRRARPWWGSGRNALSLSQPRLSPWWVPPAPRSGHGSQCRVLRPGWLPGFLQEPGLCPPIAPLAPGSWWAAGAPAPASPAALPGGRAGPSVQSRQRDPPSPLSPPGRTSPVLGFCSHSSGSGEPRAAPHAANPAINRKP